MDYDDASYEEDPEKDHKDDGYGDEKGKAGNDYPAEGKGYDYDAAARGQEYGAGGQGYEGGFDANASGGYDQDYDQYDQGGFDQAGYDQGGFDQGGFDQGYDPRYAAPQQGGNVYTDSPSLHGQHPGVRYVVN